MFVHSSLGPFFFLKNNRDEHEKIENIELSSKIETSLSRSTSPDVEENENSRLEDRINAWNAQVSLRTMTANTGGTSLGAKLGPGGSKKRPASLRKEKARKRKKKAQEYKEEGKEHKMSKPTYRRPSTPPAVPVEVSRLLQTPPIYLPRTYQLRDYYAGNIYRQ